MTDTAVSVSRGVFVFKNKKISEYKNAKGGKENIFASNLWYQSYKSMWSKVEQKIECLNENMFASLLKNLIDSVKYSYDQPVTEIPTKTLLTGINMPDHSALFSTLCKELKKTVTPHVAILYDEDCLNLKSLVEHTVGQLVNKIGISSYDTDAVDDMEDPTDEIKSKIRKTQCTFSLLQAWYDSQYGTVQSPLKRKTRLVPKPLVIIIPDFESLNDRSLQDFILIISSYLNKLPFVLIFGIATSTNAIHKSLPYRVSSKLNVQVFNSQRSTLYLNNIIENVLLSDDCPFHVGGNVFNCFTEIFLYYDLSVKRFVQNFKYAMLEHFCSSNIMALCTNPRNVSNVIQKLTNDDLDKLKNIVAYNASKNEDFKNVLADKIKNYYAYLNAFHLFLKCLHILVHDLPNAPLGNQVRELYYLAVSKNICVTPEYIEAFKLLAFRSKEELTEKITKMTDLLEEHVSNSKFNKEEVDQILDELEKRSKSIEVATTEVIEKNRVDSEKTEQMLSNTTDRKQLRKKLMQLSLSNKSMNKYEIARGDLIKYLQEVFQKYLKEPKSTSLYKIFFFDNLSIKQLILGSHRSAIHTALNDPHYYFECDCCKLPNETAILPTFPDICILYKLHLEYGKLINVYDWLQSFVYIVKPQDTDEEDNEGEERKISLELHARFTQAVADLEYLGFVKSYKRKANHVMRLTWGG
ncbi:hypothetical protein RN001_008162 [Aquatica leii]|uniref:Origin recognition complex subunit 3 n=1 Tax=Aquatica leii TaxID=1421715 RepID=A0AAN7PCZ3_9COLE|nr:hypothetical protein RN001_008162 [Aquatica leii]